MNRPTIEIADIIERFGPQLDQPDRPVGDEARSVLGALGTCRTAAQGGHVEHCAGCGHQQYAYNSCRNRHCPKCQASARAAWWEGRCADLLPVEYFHVVFTLPAELADLALQNKRVLYGLLFSAASETLQEVAADEKYLGGQIGFVGVLHTWGQNLHHHPHLHCVVPGGALSWDGQDWKSCRPGFFLPVRVLSRVFRGKYLAKLREAFAAGELEFHGRLSGLAERQRFGRWVDVLYRREWVVYAKEPFGGPEQVLKYLARYTHRVAISNHRLLSIEDGRVKFMAKDYAEGGRRRTITLDGVEFLRRFLMHVLPSGFVRIRHYGFLANCCRAAKLVCCRRCLAMAVLSDPLEFIATEPVELSSFDADTPPACPVCGAGVLERVPFGRRLRRGELIAWFGRLDST